METIIIIALFIFGVIWLITFIIGLNEKSKETMEDIIDYIKYRDKLLKK